MTVAITKSPVAVATVGVCSTWMRLCGGLASEDRSETGPLPGGQKRWPKRMPRSKGRGPNFCTRPKPLPENDPDCVETLGMTWLRYVRWGPFLTGTATLVPMHHIEGLDRDQAQLLPARVDDYVEADNPVRFIDAFVDGLDLQEAGFARVQPKPTGRPGYDPADLLKLYIYGYVNRVRSSRRLEAETRRNLEVIWLLRHLQPDFKTIADFRKDNRHAFKAVFRQFVLLCRKLDLFGRELIAVDGTRLKAVNSTDRNFTREKLTKLIQSADERLEGEIEGKKVLRIVGRRQELTPEEVQQLRDALQR